MTNTEIKTQINADIANKITAKSITPLNVGKNLKDIVDYVDQEKRPYKIYTGIFMQSGTADPTFAVMENTIGNIVWTRITNGQYNGSLTNAFTANKTFIPNKRFTEYHYSDGTRRNVYITSTPNIIGITYDDGNVGVDNLSMHLEIRIYN